MMSSQITRPRAVWISLLSLLLSVSLVAGACKQDPPKDNKENKDKPAPTSSANNTTPDASAAPNADKKNPTPPPADPSKTPPPTSPSTAANNPPANNPPATNPPTNTPPPTTATTAGSESLLRQMDATKFIPSDAVFLIAGDGLMANYARFGVVDITKRIGAPYEEAVKEITHAFGHNLLDPLVLGTLGLAIDKPAGFFLVEGGDSWAFFFQVTSPTPPLAGLLRKSFEKGGAVVEIPAPAPATIFCESDKQVCVVMRDQHVFFVRSDYGSKDGTEKLSLRIASLTLAESVAGSAAFQDTAKLAGGAHLAGFVNLQPITRSLSDRLKKVDDVAKAKEIEDAMMAAMSGAAPPDPVVVEELQWKLRSAKRYARRYTARLDLIEKILSVSPHIAFGLDDRGDHVALTARISQTKPDTFLLSGLRPNTSAFDLQLQNMPHIAFSAHGDPKAGMALIDLFGGLEGEDMAEVRDALKKELKMDLDADLIAAANGQVGLVLTLPKPDFTKRDIIDPLQIKGALVLGFKDAATLSATVEKLRAHPMIGAMMRGDAATGRFQIPVPNMTIHIALLGDRLVISSDAAIVDQIASPSPTPWTANLKNVALNKMLADQTESLRLTTDMGLMVWGFSAMVLMRSSSKMATAAMAHGSQTPEEIKLHAELARLEEQREALYTEQDTKMIQHLLKLSGPLGVLSLEAAPTPDAVSVQGGLFMGSPSLAALALDITNIVIEINTLEDAYDLKRSELGDQIRAIHDQLYGSPKTGSSTAPAVVTPPSPPSP